MATSDSVVLAFDVYGTLLSTESIAKQLAEHFGEADAANIATSWRRYQLEYTWRLNSMQIYEPFPSVTKKSLLHALREANHALSDAEISSLMDSYTTLSIFPDVEPLFSQLSSASDPSTTPSRTIIPALFTNASPQLLSSALSSSHQLSPHTHLFKHEITVDPVRRFKPDPAVYAHAAKQVGKEGKEGEIWLVSGNPFDVVGAAACGWRSAWVDRAGKGWADALGEGPTVVVKGVDEVVEKVRGYLAADA